MKIDYKKTIILAAVILIGVGSRPAVAATLNMVTPQDILAVGEKFDLDIKIDSTNQTINAAQATITFPNNLLEVIEVKKDSSIFTFWLEDPVFSNSDGTIKFIGGSQGGVSGGSLQVLKISFKAKSIGTAILAFDDSAVTANDGSGTNVLSGISGKTLIIHPNKALPPEKTPTTTPETSIKQPPVVTRPPTPANNFPLKPELKINLYPSEKEWYNISSPFLITWKLPTDISGISTALNHQSNFIPPPVSQELTEGKVIEPLSDGIRYFHARFKNNIGWGDTVHYKISLDVTPPTKFNIEFPNGQDSDDPNPSIKFNTSDGLSGINSYIISLDNGESTSTVNSEYRLQNLIPGKHRVSVKAFDKAGNSRESIGELNILPIPSPTITFITSFITLGSDETFAVKGIGSKNDTIIIKIFDQRSQVIAEGATLVNTSGDWFFTLDRDLRVGEYSATVTAKDSRGALSLPIQAGAVLVKLKPILKIGSLELTAGQLLFTVIVLIILFSVFGWYWQKRKQLIRSVRYGLVEYDFSKMIRLLEGEMMDFEKKITDGANPENIRDESLYRIQSLKKTVDKIKTYLPKEVEKLKK